MSKIDREFSSAIQSINEIYREHENEIHKLQEREKNAETVLLAIVNGLLRYNQDYFNNVDMDTLEILSKGVRNINDDLPAKYTLLDTIESEIEKRVL